MLAENSDRYEGLVLFLRSLLRARAGARAEMLLKTLLHIGDPRQGAVYLGEWLGALPAEAVVSALDALLERAGRREPGADTAVQTMLRPELRSRWHKGLSRRVQTVARLEGRYDLAVMLLELPETDGPFASSLPQDLKDIPLGTRKSWARRSDIYLMERLLSDPDRTVIANLLANPRLTQREVIRLASQRGAGEKVLEEIALHPRWIPRYQVKVALAHNPSTPVRITLGLLRLLMAPDLAALAKDSRLSRVVVERARSMLRERRGEGRD